MLLLVTMRLWTIHPKYLDAAGLTAAWREGLLARRVLQGRTRGYRHHPQLIRFRAHARPLDCIERYLDALLAEAITRGYRFDATKIAARVPRPVLRETRGQLDYEFVHLRRKLGRRAPHVYRRLSNVSVPEPHPLFRIVAGDVREWERR
jgi:hypothetical protein